MATSTDAKCATRGHRVVSAVALCCWGKNHFVVCLRTDGGPPGDDGGRVASGGV
jgi:hypothetical protein